MRALVCTEAGAGQPHEMHQVLSQYVSRITCNSVRFGLTRLVRIAVRRICLCQGVPFQTSGLQQGIVVPELRRLDCWCDRVLGRVRTSGRHQDPYPEQEL